MNTSKNNDVPAFFRHVDVHTHIDRPDAQAIVNITPRQQLGANRWYSVGIHPWDAATATDDDWCRLAALADDPRVVAIGEAGLDTRHEPIVPLDVQERVFVRQAQLAQELDKPLIIHAVGALNRIIELRRELHATVPWIIHGFRGKPQQAAELVRHGFHISIGPKHNPAALAAIPPDRLLHESDAL